MSLRHALEVAARGIVVKRRLPKEFNRLPLHVSGDARLRFLTRPMGAVDAPLLALVKELVRPGDAVWDMGANVGLFSFAAAARSGPEGYVLAVEPDSWLVGLLLSSAAHERADRAHVDVLAAALSDKRSIEKLYIAKRGRASNYIGRVTPDEKAVSRMAGGVRQSQLIPSVTLDSLLDGFRAPDLLKIDVEGAEVMALKGARKLLADVRPRIVCEVSKVNRPAVARIFNRAGYTLYDADRPGPDRPPIDSPVYNTLALPE